MMRWVAMGAIGLFIVLAIAILPGSDRGEMAMSLDQGKQVHALYKQQPED
jgi:hypothetical protein